jgi:HK97 family phage major capsid protein
MKRTVKDIKDAISELNEKFDKLEARMDSTGSDKLTDAELREMNDYPVEMRKLNTELDLANAIEMRAIDKAARMGNVNPGVGNQSISDKEVRDFAQVKVGEAIRQLAVNGKLTGLEAEVDTYARSDAENRGIALDEGFAMPAFVGKMEKRGQTATGQTTDAGDQGGVYVPTEINSFVRALWDRSFLGQVNATRLSGLKGNQSFPVQASKPAASTLTEIEAITATEILWTQLAMAPNRRGASIPVSRLLLIQGSLDTQAFIVDQLRAALSYKLDADAWATIAALTSPQLIAVGTNGGPLTRDLSIDMETAISALNADVENMFYVTNSKVRGKMKKTAIDAGSGLFLYDGKELNGYPVKVTNLVPSNLTKGSSSGVCSAIAFADWSKLFVGFWDGLVFDVERKPSTDQSLTTVNAYWDVKVGQKEAFTVIKDLTT